MEILIKAAQFFLSLSILIVIHELGHMLPARLFKIRVEKFYLFFNPWFSLFKVKRGGTEYGMGWLPLGGYVKIAGMIDESMDKEQMKQPPKPWEFRSRPAWQRLIVMLGGVTANIILAALIYIFMLSFVGEEYLPAQNVKYGVEADSLAREIGMQTGDIIVKLNDEPVDDFMDIPREFILGNVRTYTVLRNGQEVTNPVPEGFFGQLISARGRNFFTLRYPFVAHSFTEKSAAREAGVQPGDHIIGIGDVETWSFDGFRHHVPEFAGQETTLKVARNEQVLELPIQIPETGLIGVYITPTDELLSF
jgi:regulator of sigma E protease